MNQLHFEKKVSDHDMEKSLAFMIKRVSDYAIFLMDTEGVILSWNNAAETMKGYSGDEAIGRYFGMLYTEEEREKGRPEHNLKATVENGTYQEETWRQKKDGSLFWALVEIIAIKDQDGELTGFCKITRDLTDHKALQDQLAKEKEQAQVTLGAIGDAVITIDDEGNIDFLNPKAEALTGWLGEDARGRALSEVFHIIDESNQHPQEHQLISWLKQGHTFKPNFHAVLVSKDGTRYSIEDTAAPIHMPDGSVAGGVIVFRDVTQSRQLLNTITYQATHDVLTGLVNRTEFERRLQRSFLRTRQPHVTGALLYMDLDQFKIVNDTCGHAAGDELLKQLANLYGREIRERDTLARLGGDEFALIVDHCSQEEAYSIANKILQSTRDFQFVYNDRVFKVGVSIGLVTIDETIHSTEELLQLADTACYVAKEKGRNQIHRQQVSDADVVERKTDMDWVARITEALHSNRLLLHYQPIAMAGSQVGGFRYEVLLRWLDTEKGILVPGHFLPAADRYDLTSTIDRWVVQRVLKWLRDNPSHADQLAMCSIKLSTRTLADESFLSCISDLLEGHNTAPAKLCFDIAETAATTDLQKALVMINGLRAMGCKICLSGFGMASFAYLKEVPADFIKIDGQFIRGMTESVVDEKTVEFINEMAHLLGKETIATWVENEETAQVLSRIGIDYLQGHWIAYPKALGDSLHSVH